MLAAAAGLWALLFTVASPLPGQQTALDVDVLLLPAQLQLSKPYRFKIQGSQLNRTTTTHFSEVTLQEGSAIELAEDP